MDLKILIVDDDQGLLSVLSSLLEEESHDVSVCDNGLDAIEKCHAEQFDLIITDLMMPGASGMDVLKASRQASPDTLVILITGFASIESAIQAIREGAYDYVTKPFKLEEIKIAVNEAFVEITVGTILNSARHGSDGQVGDGKIFIAPLEDCIRISSGEHGKEAI